MKKVFVLLAALPALAFALAGCGGGGSAAPAQQPAPAPVASSGLGRGEAASVPREEQGLSFTLSSPRSSYRRGEEIPLTLTVTNTSDRTITTYFNNPKQAAVGYYNENREFIDLNGYVGLHVEETVIYEPGQSRQYPLTLPKGHEYDREWWRPAGRYQFVSWLTGSTDRYWFTPTISQLHTEVLGIEVTE